MKQILIALLFILFSGIACSIGAFFYLVQNSVIDFSVLAHYNPAQATIVLDDQGKEWARFAYDRREPIALERMPQHVINAFLAAEDWNFFNHAGISWKGIARSMLVNIRHGRIVQGASTITQQLVRLLFFNAQRTFARKVKEQWYSVLVEQQFSKEYILQTYLNHVYFGCGIYGVQAAAERFWGVSVEQLTIEQAATLAAIMRSPGQYCPLINPIASHKRRNVILGVMRKLHFISEQEFQDAKATPFRVKTAENDVLASHCKEYVRLFLEEKFGKELVYGGGLIVQTTINRAIQQEAENALRSNIPQLRKTLQKPVDGALISLEVKNGAIKAMVGGYDFNSSKFNRALQARRQMGSIFKPLIFSIAMEQGKSFADREVDEPLDIPVHNALWQPNNYNNQFEGTMTLARSLIRSNNIIAIKLLLNVGYQPVIDLAHRCRLPGPLAPYPSLALGCVDASVKQVVGMFSVFATMGVYHEPYLIQWVKDKYNRKIFKHTAKPERVLDARSIGQVSKVLEFGIHRMRAVYKRPLVDSDVICKTGTTNESRTCWFAGATPEIATVVYVGCDNNQSLGADVYPLRTAFPIWLGLHEKISCTQQTFVYDVSLREQIIHDITGRATFKEDVHAVPILKVR